MGAFNTAVVTKKGQALLAKTVAGTCEMKFTKMALSDAELTGDLSEITSLSSVKQTELIANVKVEDDKSTVCEVAFSNRNLNTGYFVRNIGLYAIDPDEGEILYSVSTADETVSSADWMPPLSNGVMSLLISVVTVLSSSSKIDVSVDPTALATVAQITEVKTLLDNHTHTIAGSTVEIPIVLSEENTVADLGDDGSLGDNYISGNSASCTINVSGMIKLSVSADHWGSIQIDDGNIIEVSPDKPLGNWITYVESAIHVSTAIGTVTFNTLAKVEPVDGFMSTEQVELLNALSESNKNILEALDYKLPYRKIVYNQIDTKLALSTDIAYLYECYSNSQNYTNVPFRTAVIFNSYTSNGFIGLQPVQQVAISDDGLVYERVISSKVYETDVYDFTTAWECKTYTKDDIDTLLSKKRDNDDFTPIASADKVQEKISLVGITTVTAENENYISPTIEETYIEANGVVRSTFFVNVNGNVTIEIDATATMPGGVPELQGGVFVDGIRLVAEMDMSNSTECKYYYTGEITSGITLEAQYVKWDFTTFVKNISVYSDGFMSGEQAEKLDTLESQIGDIDSALDELHSYAQALISGGEA